MEISILRNSRKANKETRNMMEYCILTYFAYWGIHNEDIKLIVNLDSKLFDDENHIAASFPLDDNTFRIEVNKNSMLDMSQQLEIIAHEIIHIKQFYTKELDKKIVDNDIILLWKGEDISHKEYEEYDHEIEAYTLQRPMATSLIEEINFFTEQVLSS